MITSILTRPLRLMLSPTAVLAVYAATATD